MTFKLPPAGFDWSPYRGLWVVVDEVVIASASKLESIREHLEKGIVARIPGDEYPAGVNELIRPSFHPLGHLWRRASPMAAVCALCKVLAGSEGSDGPCPERLGAQALRDSVIALRPAIEEIASGAHWSGGKETMINAMLVLELLDKRAKSCP